MSSYVGIVLILVTFWASIKLPVEYLPAASVAIFVLVPTKVTFALGMYTILPGTVLMLAWAMRRGVTLSVAGPVGDSAAIAVLARLLAIVLLYYFFVVFLVAGGGWAQTAWLLSFCGGVLIPVLVVWSREDLYLVRKYISIFGAVFGVFCVLESIIGLLPIYGWIYSLLGVDSNQHWLTYRSEGSFGHPLYAGSFLSCACVLSVDLWLKNRRPRYLVAGIAAVLGVFTTVSRGALLATGLGLAVVLIVALIGPSRDRRVFAALGWIVFGVLLTVAVTTGSLADRLRSQEAVSSDLAREQVYSAARLVVGENGFFGSGLGTSTSAIARYNPLGFPLESSYWQLAVSAGVAAVVGMGVLLVLCGLFSIVRGDGGSAGALCAFVLSILTYNALDQIRTQHAFIGVLLAMCLASSLIPSGGGDREEREVVGT